MAERGKTIMCSVLFLDIAEYSKKSVSGQISLKERFNAYLSVAIRDVPIDDRIILDTGDGAALSFLGDVGDALQVALSMRESLREGLHMEPPLLVRMGINLGPVRLIRDLNGQPNIVGDGINVSQRVMGFADPGQILVSRTYYDAVSRLSPEYAGMFHYQGSRTDKHVREHEIYAIGYPGEFTSTLTLSGDAGRSKGELSDLSKQIGKSWRNAVTLFREASPLKRVAYAGAVIVPILAVVVLVSAMWRSGTSVAPSPVPGAEVAAVVPASAVTAIVPGAAPSTPGALATNHSEARETLAQEAMEKTKDKEAHETITSKKSRKAARKEKAANQEKAAVRRDTKRLTQGGKLPAGKSAFIVSCTEGTTVYVDGSLVGKLGKSPKLILVDPGKHLVMLMFASRVYSKNVDFRAGNTVRVNPDICH